MPPKLTRRALTLALTASTTALAQNPPAPPPLPQNPDEELRAAKDQLAQSAQALARFDLPMATEPATHFKA